MIRSSAVARLLGSFALVGLVACTAEHTTTVDGSGEQNAPSAGNEVDTSTNGTAEAQNAPEAKDLDNSGFARSASIAAQFGVEVTVDPDPAPAPTPVPATCQSNGISGNGSITLTKRVASGFMRIDSRLAASSKVVIQEGKWFGVQVETDANVQGSVKAEVDDNGVLVIEGQGEFCANKLEVTVTLPTFRAIKLEGSGSVEIKKTGVPGDVDLALKGSGSITFDGKALTLDTKLEGDGKIVLANGSAVSTNVEIDGSGTIDASGFKVGSLTKKISVDGKFNFSF